MGESRVSFPCAIAIPMRALAMLFAVDQQQYLQGYLPIVFFTLYADNLNTVGGGQPVLTGPGFITADNAEEIQQLASEGSR